MSQEAAPIDIDGSTLSLADLVIEIERTHRLRSIRRSHEVVAIIAPAKGIAKRPLLKKKTAADIEAMLSALGGWKDVDTEELKAEIYEDRRRSIKPQPEL